MLEPGHRLFHLPEVTFTDRNIAVSWDTIDKQLVFLDCVVIILAYGSLEIEMYSHHCNTRKYEVSNLLDDKHPSPPP